MKGSIPLGLLTEVTTALPHATFSRGARRRVNDALDAGVPEVVVLRTLFSAGAQAQVDGHSKIGPHGATQRVIFDKLAADSRIFASNRIRGL